MRLRARPPASNNESPCRQRPNSSLDAVLRAITSVYRQSAMHSPVKSRVTVVGRAKLAGKRGVTRPGCGMRALLWCGRRGCGVVWFAVWARIVLCLSSCRKREQHNMAVTPERVRVSLTVVWVAHRFERSVRSHWGWQLTRRKACCKIVKLPPSRSREIVVSSC